jgi:hypothetical protein
MTKNLGRAVWTPDRIPVENFGRASLGLPYQTATVHPVPPPAELFPPEPELTEDQLKFLAGDPSTRCEIKFGQQCWCDPEIRNDSLTRQYWNDPLCAQRCRDLYQLFLAQQAYRARQAQAAGDLFWEPYRGSWYSGRDGRWFPAMPPTWDEWIAWSTPYVPPPKPIKLDGGDLFLVLVGIVFAILIQVGAASYGNAGNPVSVVMMFVVFIAFGPLSIWLRHRHPIVYGVISAYGYYSMAKGVRNSELFNPGRDQRK